MNAIHNGRTELLICKQSFSKANEYLRVFFFRMRKEWTKKRVQFAIIRFK